MSEKIVYADKRYRRKIIAILLFISLAGSIFIQWGLPIVINYLKTIEPDSAFIIIDTVLVLILLGFVLFGLYFQRLAQKILKSECFPPPGTKVIRDTPVIRGQKAKLRGYIFQVYAILWILIGLFGVLYIHYILQKLASK